MARARGNSSKKKGISVDFTDVETQANLEEGDYLLEVDEVEQKESDTSGKDYLSFTFKVAEGEFEGKKVYHNCSLQPQALFNLRGVLEALGIDVPSGPMELDPADLIGETCGATIGLETYEGKPRARIVEFFPADELEAEEEQAAPAKKAAKKEEPAAAKKKPKAEEPEEEAEEEAPAPKAKKKAKAAEPEIEVGSTVTFEDDEGDEQEGVVTEIDGDSYTVTVGKGKKAEEWELELADLTLVE